MISTWAEQSGQCPRFLCDNAGIGAISVAMPHDMYPHSRPPLSPELMLRAYAAGIFPMSEGADDTGLFWVDPQRRGIMPLDQFHVSRSLKRRMRRGGFEICINRAFGDVVAGCADREPTWINAELTQVYTVLHERGFAHSVEVWEDGMLAGGVFGITLGGVYFGESMFSRRPDASKLAMAWLIARLKVGGFSLFDTQFVTEHLLRLGASEIPRAAYRARLAQAMSNRGDFFAMPASVAAQEVLSHLSTQTS